jgi:hypothetical protein
VKANDTSCPVCGRGTLADIAFDAGRDRRSHLQSAESRELVTYSCGHEVAGPSVGAADADLLDVERRTSDETAAPIPGSRGDAG